MAKSETTTNTMARRISGGGESRRGEGGAMELERYPSSAVGSYRSASLQQDQPEKSLWGNVKKSLVK